MQFDEFLKVIDLLQNPAAYKAKIAELTARQQAIDNSIIKLNLGNDIAKAKAQASKLNEQAQEAVAQATKQAAEIVVGAQKAFDVKHAEIKQREIVADQAIANYNTIKSQQTARENDLRTAEKEIAKIQAQLALDQASLREKQAEVDARLDKLRQAMG